jgi:hypothetical protein
MTVRMRAGTRKGVLLVHIIAAGAWLGIDVVLGILVFTAALTDDVQVAATCYQALELFAIWPVLTTGLLCLASGVVLGLGTKYGLIRYWWVATKLVLNVVLSTLVLILLRPGVHEAAAVGRALAAGAGAAVRASTDMYFPPLVSGVALVFAITVSVYKPWGRIRRMVASAD